MADELTIDVQSFGPDQAVLDELAAMILAARGARAKHSDGMSTACCRSSSSTSQAASSRNHVSLNASERRSMTTRAR